METSNAILHLPVQIPESIGKVVGMIWHSDDPADLSEDMLEVQCHNGYLIDVGWQNGGYVVRVTKEGPQAFMVVNAYSAESAAELVEDYALEYGQK